MLPEIPSDIKGTAVAVRLIVFLNPQWSNRDIAKYLNLSQRRVEQIVAKHPRYYVRETGFAYTRRELVNNA